MHLPGEVSLLLTSLSLTRVLYTILACRILGEAARRGQAPPAAPPAHQSENASG